MNRFKLLLVVGVVVLGIALLFTFMGSKESPTITWKLSHTTATDSPYHIGAVKLAEVVKEKTNGKFTIDVHHSGVLGWERETLEAQQLGTLEMSAPGLGPFAAFVPSFDLTNLPFLFKDVKALEKALKSESMEKLKKDAENYGFVVLEVGLPTFRYPINNKRLIKTMADFKGMKIRTMGIPSHIETYKSFGSNVQTTAFSELYSAIQLGVVDGCENFYGNLYTQKFHEVTKYLTGLPVFINSASFVVSQKKWDELPESYQKILREAAAEGVKAMNELALQQEDEALEAMQKTGVQFYQPTDITPYIEITEPIRQKYLDKMEPWVADVAKEFMSM